VSSGFRGVHVLVDDDPRWLRDPLEQARAVAEGGPDVIQLRAKGAPDRRVLAWALAIRDVARDCGARFVVNDRFDLALLAGADAVHLGQDDVPPARLPAPVRQRLGVGRSTHDLDQAKRARDEGVEYVAFGPLFGTASKQSEFGARGLLLLHSVVEAVAPLPVVAIGGIGLDEVPRVREAGAEGFAVISAVAAADDPARAVSALVRAWEGAGAQ